MLLADENVDVQCAMPSHVRMPTQMLPSVQQDQVTAAAGLKSALKRADALAAAKADEAQAATADAAAARDRTR